MKEKKRLYVREEKSWAQACAKKYLSESSLQVMEVPQGIMLPPDNWNSQTGEFQGGVCDKDGKFVAGLFRNKPPQAGFYGVSSAYGVKDTDLKYEDKDVIFGGVLIGHFGHFILECLGRLWYVLQQDEPYKPLVFLNELDICPWFWDFFAVLGIARERIIILKSPTQFKSIVVPEESVHSWYNYTQEYLLPYRYMVEQAQKITEKKSLGKKIFLTRNRLVDSQTKCVNEDFFCRFFANHGFVMVELETFPLAEQISIVHNAEEIVAIMGSLTHWALFCRPGTKFTMLTRTSNDVLGSQCLLNEASNVDWYIVDTAMNLFYANRAVGVCLIGPTVFWQEYVRDHYGVWQEDDRWKIAYHEYLREWTDYMLQPQKWEMVKEFEPLVLLTSLNKALHQNDVMFAKENDTESINFICADAETAYYWDESKNGLFRLNLNDGEVNICYRSLLREYPAPQYGMLAKVGSFLVLTPENAEAVLIYDLENENVKTITLPAHLPRGNYRYAVVYGNWVIMTGYCQGTIIACDPQAGEIRYLLNLSAEKLKDGCDSVTTIFGKPCLVADLLYVPVIDTNQVLELNLAQGGYKIYHVGAREAAYGFAAAYAGNVWLAPSQGGPLAVWNPPTGIMQIIDRFPAAVSFSKVEGNIRFFTDVIAVGAYLWLFPWGADKILHVNMENGNIEIAAIDEIFSKPSVSCGCIANDKLLLGIDGEIKIYKI
ncbi:MAG: glycosyltransferase family 61 protein [Selenomonas ruminantium]|uniref:Glycosyltransferase family 61 protein n=1 Tax=Selenomonas ruminantium TaxID=971 RepID=A0A927WJC1_SELRU|nr:glycosyltransferase family 61 protein [Selenomonas ruminantium]MBE6085520.1 glycosyltransferase family 61 protein [Selenomonas ruminantium]